MKKNKKKNRNTGFNLKMELAHQNPRTDYVFGSLSPKCIAEIPTGGRLAYLPTGELQFGKEDFMDCATRSWLNILETKLNYLIKNKLFSDELIKWFQDNGYITERGVELSDRFIAIKSGTTRSGNSLIAPLQAGHKFGVIPKKMLPASSNMDWETYMDVNSITKEMNNLGLEFLKRININYEQVYAKDFNEFLKRDSINTAGYAWPKPIDGIYPKTEGSFNHAFMGADLPMTLVFDNYIDSVDGDFIKKLAGDYNLIDPSYRIILSLNNQKRISWWDLLKKWFVGNG